MQFSIVKKDKWKAFFDFISKSARGQQIELEVAGLEIGDQIEEDWTAMEGISYDPKGDAVYVNTGDLDHSIRMPREILILEDGARVKTISIKDADENIQTINFRRPLSLEARREERSPSPN